MHRLDRNVSGVLALARNADAAAWMQALFREKALQVGHGQAVSIAGIEA